MRLSLSTLTLLFAVTSCGRSQLLILPPHDTAIDAAVESATESATDSVTVTDTGTDAAVCAWGGFAPPVTYAVCPPGDIQSTPIAVGDFNGDGHLDIATDDFADNAAAILINNGDGSFAPMVSYAAGDWPDQIVAADFDGDGHTDLAIADCIGVSGSYQSYVAILKGHGDGTFDAPAMVPSGGDCAEQLAVGDLNADGHPDVATTNHNSNTLAILLNTGDGTFAAAVTYAVKGQSTLTLADVNGDGTLDVIAGLPSEYPAAFEILLNDGKGALTVGATYAYGVSQSSGWLPGSLIAADFHADGHPDILMTEGGSNDLLLYANPGHGVFRAPTVITVGPRTGPLVAADFNGDGTLDLAIALFTEPTGSSNDFYNLGLMLGSGGGTFSPAVTYGGAESASGIVAGDFNGDGYPDLVVGDIGWVNVLLSQCVPSAGDSGAPDATDVACTVSEPADYANWPVSDSHPQLSDNGDGTISDPVTGLTWMKATLPGSFTASEAMTACPCPWRLPVRIELESIMEYAGPFPALNPVFATEEGEIDWTATAYDGYQAGAVQWALNFYNAQSEYEGASSIETVRCVKGSTTPPATRYALGNSDAGVTEVIDNGTGLHWKQATEPGTYATFAAAQAQCASAGYRVPLISEVQTLVDTTRDLPAIDTTFFADTVLDKYWSATIIDGGDYFWTDFDDGYANWQGPEDWNLRCVR